MNIIINKDAGGLCFVEGKFIFFGILGLDKINLSPFRGVES